MCLRPSKGPVWLEEEKLGASGAMTGHSTEDWREAHTKAIFRPLSEMGMTFLRDMHRRDMTFLRHKTSP